MKKLRKRRISKILLVGTLVILLISGCKGTENSEVKESSYKDSSNKTEESIDKHQHKHNHEEGFTDDEVKDRSLADWEGQWQSAYPYVLDGTLDEVFKNKEKENNEKTFSEYKEYYAKGFQTEVEKIDIKENTVAFHQKDKSHVGEYKYEGYEILTYESGKRGVRYLFSKEAGDEEAPKSIQFSDHEIEPTKVSHFHLYFGNESHETLLKELGNWPTYYPEQMTGADIAHEMMHKH
ncbi:ZinT/AdcA family metal-binding protein [Enterococcus rivorum]|uniref:Metal-binding protein ZinT n=1 Tax=Enterococcus rivorum TaxID=762845 RepID=A0A1E5KW95_9ENTE|nr:ZinT/AdcA family metal-binding protein [Enterococcus rivorum]MBP2100097.1 zinc transport system substrate-binding protein [Enterococcus rivorum]OEH82140.1 metal-binding protein ZinT [Enterococcus rivorum]